MDEKSKVSLGNRDGLCEPRMTEAEIPGKLNGRNHLCNLRTSH